MSMTRTIKLSDGREWLVGSYIPGCGAASVLVPVGAIDGMTDAEIGAAVRALVDEAWYTVALEAAEDVHDRGHRLGLADMQSYLPEMLPYAARSSVIQLAIDIVTGKTPHPLRQRRTPPARQLQPGYIYLLRSEHGHYKIGLSKHVPTRVKSFGLTLPFKVELIHVIAAADMKPAEAQLHARYAHRHVNGEWFALTDDEVAEIKALASL